MKKLKSSKGESIAEVLIASLIMALAFVLMGSMIQASIKVINKTDDYMSDYYSLRNSFEDNSSLTTSNEYLRITYSGNLTGVDQNIKVSAKDKTVTAGAKTYEYLSFERQ